MARPRAHGHAMMSTATAAVKAADGSPVTSSQPASVASESRITIGTNTAETRSTSRCTGALPACVCATSRAICASAVSAPTLVARTTSRPSPLIVPPATSDPGSTSTGNRLAGEQRLIDGRGSVLDDAVGGELLAGPDDEPVADHELAPRRRRPRRRPGARAPRFAPRSRSARTASPERRRARDSSQRPSRMSDRHDGADLEVRVRVEPEEEHDGRPAERGQRPDRDERVHRRGAMPRVQRGRAVERPAGPEHDGSGERERDPLPAVEHERRHHRDERQRDAERDGQQRAAAAGARSADAAALASALPGSDAE